MPPHDSNDEVERLRLESLQRALNEGRAQPLDPTTLRPVILPFNMDPMTPSYQLPCKDLYVMWVVSTPSDAPGYMNEVYLSHERMAELDRLGLALPSTAMRNIAMLSGREIAVAGHGDSAGNLIGMSLTHDDGYGPARTLFGRYFQHFFPEGYWIAIPARNVAFAISKQAPDSDLVDFRDAVERTFDSQPGVCRRLLEPDEIAVPDDWLADAYAYLNSLPNAP